jgi:hypothetical protein
MTFAEMTERDARIGMEPDLSCSFYTSSDGATWAGPYTGSRGVLADSYQMQDAGYGLNLSVILVVRLAVFALVTPPVKESFFRIANVRYRLKMIDRSPDGAIVTYGLAQSV